MFHNYNIINPFIDSTINLAWLLVSSTPALVEEWLDRFQFDDDDDAVRAQWSSRYNIIKAWAWLRWVWNDDDEEDDNGNDDNNGESDNYGNDGYGNNSDDDDDIIDEGNDELKYEYDNDDANDADKDDD